MSGRIDPIEVDFVTHSIEGAETHGDEVLVVQLDSPGALIGRAELGRLAARVRDARVPVAVWVGPSGSRAYGGATQLLGAADVSGMAPGTHVGKAASSGPAGPLATSRALGPGGAVARGAVDVVAPTLGEFIVGLDGRTVGGRQLTTAKVVSQGGQPRRQAAGDVRFAKLGLVERVLHATTGPLFAYILLVGGLLLIIFEFYTAAVGLAGLAGAAALVLGSYGLTLLPTRPAGLALIGIGLFGYAVDVQAGVPRAWTLIGTIAFVAGSWLLFGAGLALSWVPILIVGALVVVFFVLGMRAMVRARFSTPVIRREPLVGRSGEADTSVDTSGVVRVGPARFVARSDAGEAIPKGAPVQVASVDGIVLSVVPESAPHRRAEVTETPADQP